MGFGHEAQAFEPGDRVALDPGVGHQALQQGATHTPSPGRWLDVHPLDLGGGGIDGLEGADADRVVTHASQEQPPPGTDQLGELEAEALVVAGEVGLLEPAAQIGEEAPGDPLPVLPEQRLDQGQRLGPAQLVELQRCLPRHPADRNGR